MKKQMIIKYKAARRFFLAFGLPVFLTFLSSALRAQSFSEWFHQDKIQRKYLLAQIAALQTYISGLEKGYSVAKSGLTTIGNITDGELGLHTLYFSSLQTVNPKIKNYSKVRGITQTEDAVDIIRKKYMQEASGSNVMSGKELSELQSINNNIASDESKDLEELKLLVSDDSLKMTDDERIKNIDKLYSTVQKKYAGIQQLAGNVHALVTSRKQQRHDVALLKQLYGGQ